MAGSASNRLFRRIGALLAFIPCLGVCSALAQAQAPQAEPPQAPGEVVTEIDPIDIPPEHDPLGHAWRRREQKGGFYLRMSASLGYTSARLGPPPWNDGDRHAYGFGNNFGLDVGGVVAPWLALHLDSSVGILWNGTVHFDNPPLTGSLNGNNRVVVYGVAPAATFFVPYGFLFKTAFGVGFGTVRQPGKDISTKPGFYMDLMAAKEVYADEHIAFALQFQILYALLHYDSSVETGNNLAARVTQYMFGLGFSYDSI